MGSNRQIATENLKTTWPRK